MIDNRMRDSERADRRTAAYIGCVALVREAVVHQRAHAAALAMTAEQRQADPDTWRLAELDYEDWYKRAGMWVDVLDGTA